MAATRGDAQPAQASPPPARSPLISGQGRDHADATTSAPFDSTLSLRVAAREPSRRPSLTLGFITPPTQPDLCATPSARSSTAAQRASGRYGATARQKS